MEYPWEDLIPAHEIEIYNEAGFSGNRVGLGESPVILLIDVQYRTAGDRKEILKSIQESGYKSSCGKHAWSAIDQMQPILKKGREKGIPVIYSNVVRSSSFDAGLWADKNPNFGSDESHRIGEKGTEVVKEVAPKKQDIVMSKRYASAFFGTHLVTQLQLLKADSVIVMGCTTSGCVRSTVIDAFSYGYKVTVPQETVYDRSMVSHKASLFDMNAKYADVIPSSELLQDLEEIEGILSV